MYHRRIAMLSGALAFSSFAVLGAGASSPPSASASGVQRDAASAVAVHPLTVHTASVVVGTKVETILVNAKGLPLYYFRSDTPTKSRVSGSLGVIWPPLVAAKPTASGVKGKVVSLKQTIGPQVSYNGHFLYTFVDDSPGHVTGQGVSNFFVVTPNIRAAGNAKASPAPAPAPQYHGYGY